VCSSDLGTAGVVGAVASFKQQHLGGV